MKRFLSLLIPLIFVVPLSAKVRILTFHYNKPEFIDLQYKCMKKFLLDDAELIVFNDASTKENEVSIQETCRKLKLQCVRFDPENHLTNTLNTKIQAWLQDSTITCPHFKNRPPETITVEDLSKQASIRHSHIIQYALDKYGYNHDDAVVIMDGDAFFIREISIKERLKTVEIFGMAKPETEGITYLWVPFIAFTPKKLPNIKEFRSDLAVINNYMHDTGSQAYYYIKNNPSIKIQLFERELSSKYRNTKPKKLKKKGFRKNEISLIKQLPETQFVEFNIDRTILHYSGSCFDHPGFQEKETAVLKFIQRILKD